MLAELHTLWIEGPLSPLERLCLASMLNQGHKVVLHSYGDVPNVPEGVEVRSAAETLAFDDNMRHKKAGNIALFSDYFRFVLLKKGAGTWIDLDCFVLRPIEVPAHGYLVGHEIKTINSAVLLLPKDCPIIDDVLTACRRPNKSPYWLDFRRRFIKRPAYFLTGKKWHLGDMGWGIVGPIALTRLLPRYGLLGMVQPMKAFYPVDRQGSARLFNPEPFDHLTDDPEVKSIHIYAKERRWEKPVPGSFMAWATEQVAAYL